MPAGAGFRAMSLLEASDATMAELFRGVDAVVHSAYVPSGQPDVYSPQPPQLDRFDAELANIRMAQRVYRFAFEAGVKRVVIVSSNHAADWYEHQQVHRLQRETVYPQDLPLSDNFYGWSKASYELLAYPYACGTFGRQLEMVMLRIGSPYPIDVSRYEPGATRAAVEPVPARRARRLQARPGRLAERRRLRSALPLRPGSTAGAVRRRRALGRRLWHLRQHPCILVPGVGTARARLQPPRRLRSGLC